MCCVDISVYHTVIGKETHLGLDVCSDVVDVEQEKSRADH